MSRLDEVLNKYQDHFKKKYPLCVTDTRTTEEIIEDIEFCIDTGNEADEPSYEEELDY